MLQSGANTYPYIMKCIWWLRCCSMTRRTSGNLFLRRPSTITRRSYPPPSFSLRHKSTEDTYQFMEIWYRFVNQLRVLGVILAYNYKTMLLFHKYGFEMTDEITLMCISYTSGRIHILQELCKNPMILG